MLHWVWPPPIVMKNTMYFFLKLDHYWGTFWKKVFFCPYEMSNTCKNIWNPKIGKKWLSMGPPSIFSPENFFTKMTQNGLKYLFVNKLLDIVFIQFIQFYSVTRMTIGWRAKNRRQQERERIPFHLSLSPFTFYTAARQGFAATFYFSPSLLSAGPAHVS